MKKNHWEVCFNAYMNECTRLRIIKESLGSINGLFKAAILVSVGLFLVFLALSFYAAVVEDRLSYNFYFPIFLIFEVISIYLMERAQQAYKSDNYSDVELSQIPPENVRDQKVRYLKFRRTLKESKINSSNVSPLLEILKARIELNQNSGVTVKKMFGWAFTFSMAILAATMKNLDLTVIGQIGAVGVLSVCFLYMVTSIKPNKIEQLYELKYFLVMYEKENKIKSL